MNEVQCPYCGYDYDLCHDDGAFYTNEIRQKEDCPACENVFMVLPQLSWTYWSEKADCLNGGKHDWEPVIGVPREYFFSVFSCAGCDQKETRDPEGRKQALAR